ncbi:MAG: hypothetical protein ACD_28C00258G0002 [uncultured bacterium]|nr:MAG: hypothetical protein ACD_28C00258G0002 [uncultured bacterium]
MIKPDSIHIIGIATKFEMDRAGMAILNKAVQFLKKKGVELIFDKNAATHLKLRKFSTHDELMEVPDFLITFGGDGTIIKLAGHAGYKPIPVLTVNLGRVGLLTEVQNTEKIVEVIKHIFNKRYHIDARSMLRATIYRKGKKRDTFLALNEVVINQGSFARLIDLDAEINQRKMVRFKADGVIVSTATGSTGHSLSAGGPIVHPKLDAFVFTPICPATLSMCPIVIPSSRQLTITIETQRKAKGNFIALTIDGQKSVELEYGDQIKIRRSSREFYMARISNTRYYKVLRDRLNWGD